MNVILVLTIAMLAVGVTVLREWLDPHEHRLRFILFWLACAWGTITTLLLAIFDLLRVRAQARASQKAIREQFSGEPEASHSMEPRE